MHDDIHATDSLRRDETAADVGGASFWKRHTTIASGVTAVLVVVAASCGGGSDEATPAAGTSGESLYQANCASCHGVDLRGTDKGPSHLSIVYEPGHHGDDAFRSAILNGARQHHWAFGDMAPVPDLTGDEIEDIIAYVRAEQERQGFEQ